MSRRRKQPELVPRAAEVALSEEQLRAWLERVPGVQRGSLNTSPVGKGETINDHGVSYKLRVENKLKSRRTACKPEVRPTLNHALAGALEALRRELGESAVDSVASDAAGPSEPPPAEYTQEELDWLAEWCEDQEDPSTISAEQCEAALAEQRARTGRSAVSVLHRTQLLQACVRAAERHADRAQARLQRARAQLPVPERQEKRPRTEPPQPWASWDESDRRRQEALVHDAAAINEASSEAHAVELKPQYCKGWSEHEWRRQETWIWRWMQPRAGSAGEPCA